jgi:hypothetical protein
VIPDLSEVLSKTSIAKSYCRILEKAEVEGRRDAVTDASGQAKKGRTT